MTQQMATARRNKGMQTMRAAKNMANPTTLLRNPPRSGTYPNSVVIGLKNAQIENTIMKYASTRKAVRLQSMLFSYL